MKRREFIKTTVATGVGLTQINDLFSQETMDIYYDQLANALDRLPNAFPRTESNVEILLLKKIFSPEQARVGSQLTGTDEKIETISQRAKLSVEETTAILTEMSQLDLIQGSVENGMVRLRPFIVGIYESSYNLEHMDHEFAHLFEMYMDEGGAELMRPQPAIHRVIPTQSALKKEWILPYDDLREMIMSSQGFRLRECICRKN